MKTVKQIRTQLNLSQADMARYLGIGRTALALAELGRATLNVNALKKLARLESCVLKVTGVDSSAELPGNDLTEYLKGYELQEQNLLYQAGLLQKKLDDLDKLYEWNHCLYNVLKELEKGGQDDPAWLTDVKNKALAKLCTCSLEIRDTLRNKMRKLTDDAAGIRQYLESKRSIL